MNWIIWVLFVGLLWISPGMSKKDKPSCCNLRKCFKDKTTHLIVADKFNGFITNPTYGNLNIFGAGDGCIVFLQKNETLQQGLQKEWLQMETKDDNYLLYISKWHITNELKLYILRGRKCNATLSNFNASSADSNTNTCKIRYFKTKTVCEVSTYDKTYCSKIDPKVKDKYIINITTTKADCINCDNPVKTPEKTFDRDSLSRQYNVTLEVEEEVDAAQAAEVMSKMALIASSMNDSSALLTMGEGVEGVLVREEQPEDVKEVSFAYVSPTANINIIETRSILASFSRSVTVPKEAFKQAVSLNVSVPFASFFRFTNLAKDAKNSTVLGNEVLAVEMGAAISNLTDKISISFQDMKYKGIPSCRSWNGEGSQPNWIADGCLTVYGEDNITCQCSHLTFFAILLTPLNETISSSDLNNLTIITQVGCGLSMFFLSIVLFMHFLLRKTKASETTRILIHLVFALFLLNFTFLINNFVAKLKSSVGCKIIAALMHYFMLATFTWFAVQAFHHCLQMRMWGKTVIRHYMLKLCITSWILPSIVGIVLLIIGKYGEQVIHTDDTETGVAMCWITDSDVHNIVNIGYYALVFLFTFTTFIMIISWFCCLKRTNAADAKVGSSCKSIVTILGLCSMLGVTWGFAFFAYGDLRIPSYYIFTVLNSFQGFFLFIYYYNTSHSGDINGDKHKNLNTSSSNSTLKTDADSCKNPYCNLQGRK